LLQLTRVQNTCRRGWKENTFLLSTSWLVNRLVYAYVILVIVFLVAFPKGGIKVDSIPVTWGYVLLFLPFPLYLISTVRHKVLPAHLLTYLLIRLFLVFILVPFCFFLFPYIVEIAGLSSDFLFDKNLGGRIDQLSVLKHLSLAGDLKPLGIIKEIVYLSILENFGIIGLFLFLIYLLSPLIICMYFKIYSTLQIGIIVYLLVCTMDGVMLLIPTMCFFWFISSLSLHKTI
jgi:hypothetical protein